MYSEKAGNIFSGDYDDLADIPLEFMPSAHTHQESEILDLQHYSDGDIDGSEAAFNNWDKNVTDDFSGDYNSLTNKPNLSGFLTTEADPIFDSHVASDITSTNITNWNIAYSWGDHSAAGYLKTEVDGSTTNEIQDLSLTGNTLSLSNDPTTVNLDKYLDNTDDQGLQMSSDVLTIEGGTGSVDLKNYIDDADPDPTNELQILSISNDSVFLSDGGFVKLPLPGPYFTPTVTYPIGGVGSPYTIDISSDFPNGARALIAVVEFFNFWTVEYYGGSYLEAYYGGQSENEKIRIENPIEDTNNPNYYTQSGPIRVQMIIPVIEGDQLVLKHIGVNKIDVSGYFK